MRDTKDSENVSFLKELFFEAGKPSLEHFGLTEITDIKKEHVHKEIFENMLLKRVGRCVDAKEYSQYLAEVLVNKEHEFFFEHESVHLPGLYIIEAGRQIGLAIPHIFYDIPYGDAFVLEGCNIDFKDFANLNSPIFIKCSILNPIYRKRKLTSMSFLGTFIQDDKEIVHYESHIKIMDKRLLKRLERRQKYD